MEEQANAVAIEIVARRSERSAFWMVETGESRTPPWARGGSLVGSLGVGSQWNGRVLRRK
jgi:hypothetical protein